VAGDRAGLCGSGVLIFQTSWPSNARPRQNLIYRDQLFPRPAYRRCGERLSEAPPPRIACRIMVGFLAVAHERLRGRTRPALDNLPDAGALPDLEGLRCRFTPVATADRDGWPAARFLAALAEHEIAERGRRRIERHLIDARLPPGKTLDSFDFTAVPMVSKAHIMALAANDGWLEKGTHCLCFGPPGCGKTHLGAGLGRALVENGFRVLFTRTTDFVQRLQVARQELALEAAIAKLDKVHLLISTTSPPCRRARPRPASCSSSSPPATSDAAS
jgi:IstB-like ATP binding protein